MRSAVRVLAIVMISMLVGVRVLMAQATTRVSMDSNGGEAKGESLDAAISSDGWSVAFTSLATNLVPGDTNNMGDVFVHDRQTGETTRVSVDCNGGEASGGILYSAACGDARAGAGGGGDAGAPALSRGV